MLIFLDTEFTDFVDCDLISIALVSEDGKREFYAERSDYPAERCNAFVQAAVLPQLGQAGPGHSREQLASLLKQWFFTLPRSVTVACDSLIDWELLIGAMDHIRPDNLTGRYDLRGHIDSTVFHRAVVQYHERNGRWHHSLHDARAHRRGWLAWMDSRKYSQN